MLSNTRPSSAATCPPSQLSLFPDVAQPTLDQLRQRYQRGEGIQIGDVFRAAGLDRRERYVLRERLDGRPFGAIGADLHYTRQRVHQLEAQALRKLGLRASLAEAVHSGERADRAEELSVRG